MTNSWLLRLLYFLFGEIWFLISHVQGYTNSLFALQMKIYLALGIVLNHLRGVSRALNAIDYAQIRRISLLSHPNKEYVRVSYVNEPVKTRII